MEIRNAVTPRAKLTWAPSDAVLNYFSQLQGRDESADQLYVLALWMVRRRILRWDETRHDDQGSEIIVPVLCGE